MKLFDEYPELRDDMIILRRPQEEDADVLLKMCNNERICRYLPTFLEEQKYEDKREAIRKMYFDSFLNKRAIHLGIYLSEGNIDNNSFAGIFEIYDFDEKKGDVSLGIRIDEGFWDKGLATRVIRLVLDYLNNCEGIKTASAHIMPDNKASAAIAVKLGFIRIEAGREEDWGFGENIFVDKYIYYFDR